MTIRLLALGALLLTACGGQQRVEDAATEREATAASLATPSSTPAVVAATEGHVPISIRLAGELTEELRAELDALGMVWQRDANGGLVHIGPIYSGSAPAENTAAMQALEGVVRVEQSGRAPVVVPEANALFPIPWECDPRRSMMPEPHCYERVGPPVLNGEE